MVELTTRDDDVDEDLQITVLLGHPDRSTRDSLATRLRDGGQILVTAADDPSQLVTIAAERLPDVVALPAGVPGLDAASVVGRLRDEVPVARGVLLTADDSEAARAVTAGAWSCTIESPGEDLGPVVLGTHRGEAHLTPNVAAAVLAELDRLEEALVDHAALTTLTPTEREVLARRARGETSEAIAEDHDVSTRLVDLHAGYAVAKLHWAVEVEEQLTAHS